MFFFFPFSTDAPIYHWPRATVGLIILNVLAFIALSGEDVDPATGMLVFGEFNPIQWVTAIFVHAGFGHLLGNMLFLWAFGLVVEGKLGWVKFLIAYLGIGIGQMAITQIVMLGAVDQYACGASGAINGIMAMALIWAPKNDMSCFYVIMVRTGIVEVPILLFAGGLIALDVLTFFLFGMHIGTSAMHLTGVLLGAAAGVWLLKSGQVDCEDWDIFALWLGKEGRLAREEREEAIDKKIVAKVEVSKEKIKTKVAEMVDYFLEHKNLDQAIAALKKADTPPRSLKLPAKTWQTLITQMHAAGKHRESIPYLASLLEQYPEKSERVRLKLAEVLLEHDRRPAKAIEVLAPLSAPDTPALIASHRDALLAKAQAAMANEDAELELDLDL